MIYNGINLKWRQQKFKWLIGQSVCKQITYGDGIYLII